MVGMEEADGRTNRVGWLGRNQRMVGMVGMGGKGEGGERMKVFVSCDMEGVAGVVDWSQCRPGGSGYDAACALMLAEVNAAIEGALAAGADEVVVNDSHGGMANLDPAMLRRPGQLSVRPAQARLHDGGPRRELRRRVLPGLPRVDLRPVVRPVAHLQPRGHRRGAAQRPTRR